MTLSQRDDQTHIYNVVVVVLIYAVLQSLFERGGGQVLRGIIDTKLITARDSITQFARRQQIKKLHFIYLKKHTAQYQFQFLLIQYLSYTYLKKYIYTYKPNIFDFNAENVIRENPIINEELNDLTLTQI